MNVAVRAHAIMIDPPTEWAKIDAEPGDVVTLLTSYVAPLAAIPALSGFIGARLVGVVVPGDGTVRASVLQGFLGAAFGFVSACATVILLAFVINLVAPVFRSRRSFERAFKLAVYSYTPFWLSGIFLLAPGLRFLVVLSLYGVYLLWKGLPPVMGTPRAKIAGFTAAIASCAGALTLIFTAAEHAMFGLPVL